MLLIINLGIILSLLIIVLFNIINIKDQILTSLCVLVILFLFKIIFNKLIKNNKKNVDGKNIYMNNKNNNVVNNSNCVYRNDCVDHNNSFDLKNVNSIVSDLKNIINEEQNNNQNNQNNDNKRIVVDKNDYVFAKESGNEEFHFKDLHNKVTSERLNVSEKGSLLLNNVDCTNDTSCIIQPSIYNFHKY